jgi:hypothetical protein
MEHHHVGRGLDGVDDIVELAGERLDVLAVERGDEGRVEPGEDGVGEPVALVLGLHQPFGLHLRVDEVLDQVEQQRGGVRDVVGYHVEQVEVGLLTGKDPQLHAPSDG